MIEAMAKSSSGDMSLDSLRQQIDGIDDQIHDLLIRRADIAGVVREVKTKSGASVSFIRPAREAEILRRLAARHEGHFPTSLITRIWREIISATLTLETNFSASVFSPHDVETGLAYMWLARTYFGIDGTVRTAGTASGVLRAVRDGKAAVGVLPMPSDDRFSRDEIPWWTTLASGGEGRPMIMARLPWSHGQGDVVAGLEALVVAKVLLEPSGDDVSYVALRFTDSVSRDRIRQGLKATGLEMVGAVAANPRETRGGPAWQLFEIDGFIAEGDERLESFGAAIGDAVESMVVLGSYARPLRG